MEFKAVVLVIVQQVIVVQHAKQLINAQLMNSAKDAISES